MTLSSKETARYHQLGGIGLSMTKQEHEEYTALYRKKNGDDTPKQDSPFDQANPFADAIRNPVFTKTPVLVKKNQPEAMIGALATKVPKVTAAPVLTAAHAPIAVKVWLDNPILPPGIPESTLGPLKGTYPLTDVGNGERMSGRFGRYAKRVPELGWTIYDGTRFALDPEDAEVGILASVSARLIPIQETLNVDSNRERKAIGDHAHNSESDPGIDHAVKQFRKRVTVRITKFDANPYIFNTKNKTLVIGKDGRVSPKDHDPDDLLLLVAGTDYDPDAKAEKWNAFLERNVPDPEVRKWLRRYVGSMLFGANKKKVIAFLWGVKNSGKTTFKEIVLALLGEYGGITSWKTFEDQNDDKARNELARLYGMRGIFASESQSDTTLNLALMKELSGLDTVPARNLYKKAFQYKPGFKIVLVGNNKPKIRGDDSDTIWDRLKIIPFEIEIPEAERNDNLQDELKEELPGILNWAIEGLTEWTREGLPKVQKIVKATEQYQREENPVIEFATEWCVLDPKAETSFAALKMEYSKWAQVYGKFQPKNLDDFLGKRLKNIPGVTKKHTENGNFYVGIGFHPSAATKASNPSAYGENAQKLKGPESTSTDFPSSQSHEGVPGNHLQDPSAFRNPSAVLKPVVDRRGDPQ